MDYGFSKRIPANDPRQKKWAKQRKKRGFDDTETWSLDVTFAKFLVPRLKRFKKINNGIPHGLTEEKWNKVLDVIIEGFEEVIKNGAGELYDPDKVEKGLNLFKIWFRGMWW